MKNYFQILGSHKGLIVSLAVLCGIFGFIFAKFTPTTYTASNLLIVHHVNKAKTSDFQYDNYYAAQATEMIGNTVSSFLQTPEIANEIYKKAGREKEMTDLNKDVKNFKPRQISSHLVRVRVMTGDAGLSEDLSKAMVKVLQEKVRGLETNEDSKNSFDISAEKPIVFPNKYEPWLVSLVALVCGAFLGFAGAFLKEYFREEA